MAVRGPTVLLSWYQVGTDEEEGSEPWTVFFCHIRECLQWRNGGGEVVASELRVLISLDLCELGPKASW